MNKNLSVIVAIFFALASFNTYAEIKITANELFEKYDRNEVAADSKFKGKTVTVTGIIQDIGLDILGDPYVVIGGTGFLDGVQFTFSKKRKSSIMNLSKGQEVTIKGTVNGKMANVQVENSKIVEPSN